MKLFEIIQQKPKLQIIPKNKWSPYKNDPTEYDGENHVIRVRDDYDYKTDPAGWIIHELEHTRLDFDGHQDDGKEYPFNSTEVQAYTKQFVYLKKKGYQFNDIFNLIGQHKKKYKQIFKQYWNNQPIT